LILDIPRVERAVVVFYPHTTNWDFVIGLLARYGLNVPVLWAGKDNIFRGPFAWLWRRLGGIPVNRRESTGFVAQMIDAFSRRARMLLAIAPEGTRRRTEHWKSGFYRVAVGARVPLVLSFIDFARNEVRCRRDDRADGGSGSGHGALARVLRDQDRTPSGQGGPGGAEAGSGESLTKKCRTPACSSSCQRAASLPACYLGAAGGAGAAGGVRWCWRSRRGRRSRPHP
jgi:hypothetical protein